MIELPPGCSFQGDERALGNEFQNGLSESSMMWLRRWACNEMASQAFYRNILKNILAGGNPVLHPAMQMRDSTGTLTYSQMLEEALKAQEEDRFVVTTSNRLGPNTLSTRALVLGGKFNFKLAQPSYQISYGASERRTEGSFIGVIINMNSLMGSNQKRIPLSNQAVWDMVEATISAYLKLEAVKGAGELDGLFTQNDFTRATDWLIGY